jgi:hypothetical protein
MPVMPTCCANASTGEPGSDQRAACRLSQGVDGCDRHDPPGHSGKAFVEGDERIRLKLGEREVLRVVRRCPTQLVSQCPGQAPKHAVAEKPDAHLSDAGRRSRATSAESSP